MPDASPIGIFDSGLGGLTVVREVFHLMPRTPIIYVADSAHVPYGPRPASEIQAFARGIIQALISEGAKAVIAACNMSSALALPFIADEYSIPLVGMIGAGVSAALESLKDGPLGVIATEGTCKSGAYLAEAERRRPGLTVLQSPCPEFVPLAESGRTDGATAREAAHRRLKPLLDAGCETIILGCTHYPLLLPVLQEVAGESVRFADPAKAAVSELMRKCPSLIGDAPKPTRRFATTGEPERLEEGLRRWLGIDAEAECWPIWKGERMAPALDALESSLSA